MKFHVVQVEFEGPWHRCLALEGSVMKVGYVGQCPAVSERFGFDVLLTTVFDASSIRVRVHNGRINGSCACHSLIFPREMAAKQ